MTDGGGFDERKEDRMTTAVATEAGVGIPQLTCLGRPLDMTPEAFGVMRDANDFLNDGAALRRRMDEEGYLLFRGVLGRDRVLEARREMLRRLAAEGALEPDAPRMDGVLREGWENNFRTGLAKDNPPLMRVLYDGPMMEILERLIGQPVRHYDYTWVRSVGPGHGTPPHYDIVYMGRGTWNLWTAWTPIGDVSWDLGGLMVIPGTHKHERLLRGYARRDVDTYCTNRPSAAGWNAPGSDGWLTKDPVGVRRRLGTWTSAEYRAGDVVIFSTCLVHAGLDNRTNRIRLSTDSRYQPASEPTDERWIGEHPVGHGPTAKRGLIC